MSMFVIQSQGEIGSITIVKGVEGDATLICTSRTGQLWSFFSDDAVMWKKHIFTGQKVFSASLALMIFVLVRPYLCAKELLEGEENGIPLRRW